MEDLLNEAPQGSEDTSVAVDKPVSIRDSLKAAMDEAGPATTPSDGRGNVNRDEGGRFATKPAEPVQKDAAAPVQPAAAATTPDPAAAVTTPVVKAPPGWSPEAKTAFDTLPDHVKAAVYKREQEVENGFKVLQDYKGLEEFTPMVRQAGTSHVDVMRRAVEWERSLQTDPENTVLNAARLGKVNIIELAQKIQSGQFNGQQQRQQQPQPQQFQQPNVQQAVDQALRARDTENQVSAFLADPANVHANDDAVTRHMEALIKSGAAKSLKDAYDMAIWSNPTIRATLISQQSAPVVDQAQKAAAVAQARNASKSITGSSAPGASSNNAGQQAPTSLRDSLKAAYRSSGGSV